MSLSPTPTPKTKYVILEGLNSFVRTMLPWTSRSTPSDAVKLDDGSVGFKVIGYANSVTLAGEHMNLGLCYCHPAKITSLP